MLSKFFQNPQFFQNMNVCFLLGNRTFRIVPRVSHTHSGLLHPFEEHPTHVNYFSFHNLNHESLLDVVPKTTQPTFTKSGEQPYRAPTPDSTRCHRAHECNDANSYIQFQWLTHNYISYNSNIHVNTSISMH